MNILLFGATGQLGASLAKAFAAQSIDCIALTRKDCDFAAVTKVELESLVKKHAPTLIVNAAAYAAVDDAEKHTNEARLVNGQVPGWLAEIAGKQNIRFVHFSTDYVFDGARGAPYAESAKTNPVNHYGKTKLDGERAIMRSRAKAYIFRLQLLYQETGNSFFCRMLQLLGERESLKVVADQIAAPTSVADVTHAVLQALPLIHYDTLSLGIYHMAASGHTSRHGFTCLMREEMLVRGMACKTEVIEPVVSEEFPTPAERPKDVRLNTDKLAAHGITLPHWRTSLKKVMDEVA